MKKHTLVVLLFLVPVFCFSQGVKANLYDRFLKKQRIESDDLAMMGLPPKNKLMLSFSAIGSTLYLTLSGAGWGTTTVDNGDELILLFSNDSVVTLRSAALQSFEPGLMQNTYTHQYLISNKNLETLAAYELSGIRKYSFETFSDIKIPKENADRIKKLSTSFVSELKKASIHKTVKSIRLKDIRQYIGDSVEFCSKVYKTRYFQDSKDGPTLLDVQSDFSDPFINVVILEKDRSKFNDAPEKRYLNKDVCISGVVTLHDNIPYLVVRQKEQVKMKSSVSLSEIDLFIGDSVTVKGKVFTARSLDDGKTKRTLLNVGAPYPDQPLTLVINQEDRNNFVSPEEVYLNKTLMINGTVVAFGGKPQIVLRDVHQVTIVADQESQTTAFTSVASETAAVKHTAQNKAKQPLPETAEPTNAPLVNAEFPGGDFAFRIFLRENLIYPEQLKAHEQKKVVASFEIDENGTCGKVAIVESSGEVYDREVKRVLLKMPKWKPASKGGVFIPVTITQPIVFRGH